MQVCLRLSRNCNVLTALIQSSFVTKLAKKDKQGFSTMSESQASLEKFNEITEGKATVLQPASVFYNPVQEFNRDLTIAVISEYAEGFITETRQKKLKALKKGNPGVENLEVEEVPLVAGQCHPDGIKILEGLAASGLRSMRFGLEIPGVKNIVANDFDKKAVEVIEQNIKKNGLEDLITASKNDAAMLMYQNRRYTDRFDVIDLDPYGTPGPFLDAAVQSVKDGGIICVTCTDAGTLCGNFPEKTYTMYGGVPLKSKCCHEIGLRIALHSLQAHASVYSRYIVPLISLSVDFYFRLFVRVYTGAYKTKFSASHTGMVYHCTGCGSLTTHRLCDVQHGKGDNNLYFPARGPPVGQTCEHCGFKHQMGGPMYLGPLHDVDFVERVIARVVAQPEKFSTVKRIEGMLSVVAEELEIPLYYELDGLCSVIHCHPMKMKAIRSAILNAGYKVTYSHALKNSLKTDAPNKFIWDIFRAWVKKMPVNPKRLDPSTPGGSILKQEPTAEIIFEDHPNAIPRTLTENLVRYQPNPERNWGPKPRAKKSGDGNDMETRRLKNQGKRKRKAEEDIEEETNKLETKCEKISEEK